MESTPRSTKSDPESDFDTKKSKDKRSRFESMSEGGLLALRQSQQIVREALGREEDDPEEDDSVQRIAHRAFERRKRAPEAKQLHGTEAEPKRIGRVLVAAEATKRQEEHLPAGSESERITSSKRIDTLSRPELLHISDQVVIEGASLRQIYETHLIGEQALRRLIAEYFHGGDMQKALQREILEHEIDFERDPALRGMALPIDEDSDETKKVTAPGKEALNQLLQRAGDGLFGNDEETSYVNSDTQHKAGQSVKRSLRQRQSIDIVMWVTIAVLIILVIALFFLHH